VGELRYTKLSGSDPSSSVVTTAWISTRISYKGKRVVTGRSRKRRKTVSMVLVIGVLTLGLAMIALKISLVGRRITQSKLTPLERQARGESLDRGAFREAQGQFDLLVGRPRYAFRMFLLTTGLIALLMFPLFLFVFWARGINDPTWHVPLWNTVLVAVLTSMLLNSAYRIRAFRAVRRAIRTNHVPSKESSEPPAEESGSRPL